MDQIRNHEKSSRVTHTAIFVLIIVALVALYGAVVKVDKMRRADKAKAKTTVGVLQEEVQAIKVQVDANAEAIEDSPEP